MLGKLNRYLTRFSILLTTAALIAGMVGCDGGSGYHPDPPPSQNLEIRTWYDLDDVRDNLAGNHTLMNDLDSTTAGYTELASPTANGGKGWEPIENFIPEWGHMGFVGTFEGQGHEIRDLFINRPDEDTVGLFSMVDEIYGGGVIKDIGLTNITVIGNWGVGGLVGRNIRGTVSNSSVIGSVSGDFSVGGLVGYNQGPVSNCYATGNVVVGGNVGHVGAVIGGFGVGGLIGVTEEATVSSCFFIGNVTSYLSCVDEWKDLVGVGGLVGVNYGTVSNSYSTGSVTGGWNVGGLVGTNRYGGAVSDSYSSGRVTGVDGVGGLVGAGGAVSNSYSTGSVTGEYGVGGLVGAGGAVSDSYSTGSVTGDKWVGGLVGYHSGTISNSFYNYDEGLINGEKIITIGALFDEDFDEWLANNKFLDVNEKLSEENGYYMVNNVTDFKQLLAFGQNGALKFRLTNDLDLATEPDFYIPYLAGEFDGNGHRISNLSFNFGFVSLVGLFGYLAPDGKVTQVGVENVNITGLDFVGGLVGWNLDGALSDSYTTGSVTGGDGVGGLVGWNINGGTVSNSYFTGSVTGDGWVGGLVGFHSGTVSDSYATSSVTGDEWVGGLVGSNSGDGALTNSFYNYDEGLINGDKVITIGALFGEDFDEWLANGKFLDVNERLSQESGYYVISDVNDFKQLLAFGQDGSLKFRLKNDLNLAAEPSLYIPYFAGEFDGNGHRISNLSFNFGFVSLVGLFGYLAPDGKVTELGVENVNITATAFVGGLVGMNREGTVSDSYSTGSVTSYGFYESVLEIHISCVGGLVGHNSHGTVNSSYSTCSVTGTGWVGGLVGSNVEGTVSSSYSTGSVTGDSRVGGLVGFMQSGPNAFASVSESYSTGSVTGEDGVGGLVGRNEATVIDSYSTGSVTGDVNVGGLVGDNPGTVSDSFWDTQASGQATSAGGTGKTTAEMQKITTFSGAGWNIITVALNQTNPAYIWNIVDDETYPFLSWQL